MSLSSTKIVWDHSYSTGHIATDLQHQILIDIFNDLIDVIDTDEAEQHFFIILDRLQHYAEWHFQREEQCMLEYHCPASEVNKTAHMSFVRKIMEFRQQSDEKVTLDIVHQLYHELSHWIVNHIKKVDCTLNECVNEYDFNNKPQQE